VLHLFDKQAQAAVPMADDEAFQKTVSSFFQMEKQVAAVEAGHPHKPAPMPSLGLFWNSLKSLRHKELRLIAEQAASP
jgi:hypothetical protein